MSRLSRLKLLGIRSFGSDEGDEQEVRFSCPVTLFLGQNGCGKTTIIEALKYAITGDLPAGSVKGQGFIYDPQMARRFETKGQIKVKIYDMKGNALTVTKIAKVRQMRDKQTFSVMDAIITRNGETITNRCADVHRDVCLALGVPRSIVNYVIFCHQEESHWPFDEPKKLKERFDAIFDSAKYNKCIDNMMKLKKQKNEQLRELLTKLDYAKDTKKLMEKKKDQLTEKQQRYDTLFENLNDLNEQIGPLERKLEEIEQQEKKIQELEVKIAAAKNKYNLNKEQQEELLKNITELKCSDEELEEKILSFQNNLDTTQNEIDKQENRKKDMETKESRLNVQINKEQRKLGEYQSKEKENNQNISFRTNLFEKTIQEFNIQTSSNDQNDIIVTLKNYKKKSENEIKQFETSSEQREKQLQNEIDNYKTKYDQLSQIIELKTQQKKDYKNELQKVTQKLDEMNTYDEQLNNLESRLTRIENEITQVEAQVNVNDLKTEISTKKRELNNLEDQQQKVDDEISIMQNYISVQTELDLQNEKLTQRQRDIIKLKSKRKDDFKHVFEDQVLAETYLKNNKPLFTDLQNYIKTNINSINDLNIKINNVQKEIVKIETNLKVDKKELLKLETEYENNSQTIKKYFGDKTFDEKLDEVTIKIEKHQKKKSIYTSSMHLYQKFIKNIQTDKPCCPICSRDMNEQNLVKKVISDLQTKINNMPTAKEESEKELENAKLEHSKICELKTTYYKVNLLKTTEIPNVKEKVNNLETKFHKYTQEVNNLQYEIKKPQENKEIADKITKDITLIDEYVSEITKIQKEISSLSSKMSQNESIRTLQEATNEQENLKASIKSTRATIDSLSSKLENFQQRLQTLKEKRNELKTKELNLKKDIQEKEEYRNKRKDLETKIKNIVNELMIISDDIQPMERKLQNAKENKEATRSKDKLKKNELTVTLNKFNENLSKIITLHDNINKFIENKISEKISSIISIVEDYNQQLKNYSESKNSINETIQELKEQILNRKGHYRELLDNKKLREKKKESKIMHIELKSLDMKLGEQDIETIKMQKKKLLEKYNKLTYEINLAEGTRKELKNSIAESTKELAEPYLANAPQNYKTKFLERKVLQEVIIELDQFRKAVDWAMLKYHQQQMVYINESIRELWRAIYRGNDIDYIEIKTDEMGTAKTGSEKRRIYQYRLVQVKNDVELEMRGRCSAGQKVLASLIIRIALADTFSLKCGILALDEPTTNLDKQNIESLCDALCALINRKKDQKNFQLLVITHDQDFLEKLSRTVLIENYYLVTRNEKGKSTLTVKELN